MVAVKQGDKFPVVFTVNHDLSGATVRLIVRHLTRTGEFELLEHAITDPVNGEVTYTLDGTWGVGRHFLELEISQGGEIRTAPTGEPYVLRVLADLDEGAN